MDASTSLDIREIAGKARLNEKVPFSSFTTTVWANAAVNVCIPPVSRVTTVA